MMRDFSRYRVHAEALMQISRKFRELSEIDVENYDLLAQCAANLTELAELLISDSRDTALVSTALH
ncbi:MAG: hypothetical protein BroJett029_03910 [Alphaproteobacteria bacterium]|nr:MAG: hypothetical protein BroJett029_03910 [Alphaproteobacteria bacterium]